MLFHNCVEQVKVTAFTSPVFTFILKWQNTLGHIHRLFVWQWNSLYSFLKVKNLCEVPTSSFSILHQNLFLCLPSGEWWLMAQMRPLKLGSLNGNKYLPFQIESKCLSRNWNLTYFYNFQRVCKMECELKEMLWKYVLFYFILLGKERLARDSFTIIF